MRRFIILSVCLIISFSLFAKPKVVATASIFMDMAKQIAGENVELYTIVPIGADPHMYEPTPADAALVASADLILKNGLTFEGWLDELINNSSTNADVVLITEGVKPIQSVEFHNATDPHAWMSIFNAFFYIHNIKNALCKLDPNNASIYERNYENYRVRLLKLDQEIKSKINILPMNKRILITSHDAFHYYAQEYNLTVEADLGTSTDAEVQTSDIIRLNNLIKNNNIPAVFIETTINPKLLHQIAKDNQCIIGGSLYADSIGEADSAAPTYEAMLRYNTDQIVNALSKNQEIKQYYKDIPIYDLSWILVFMLGLWVFLLFNIKKF